MLSETLKEFEKCYEGLNESLFNNSLPTAYILIQHETKKRKNFTTHGWFSTNITWKDDNNEEIYEITITPNCLENSYIDIIGTLVHEMVHVYCHVNQIDDCIGKKHTENFKFEAERAGLICEKEKTIGWGLTTVSMELREKILEIDINEDVFAKTCDIYIPEKEPKKKKPQPTYICPLCNEKIKSKKLDLAIMCVKCNKQFELILPEEN